MKIGDFRISHDAESKVGTRAVNMVDLALCESVNLKQGLETKRPHCGWVSQSKKEKDFDSRRRHWKNTKEAKAKVDCVEIVL